MSEGPHTLDQPYVHHQFDDAEQQRSAYTLGMWIFLATEVLFFGGLFTLYTIYYIRYPHAFHAASHHLDIVLGTLNTAVLLGSSLTMALGIWSLDGGRRQAAIKLFLATMALGAAFLVIKAFEYQHKFAEGHWPGASGEFEFAPEHLQGARLYFALYFAMTGLHALHMLIGIAVVGTVVLLIRRGHFGPNYIEPVEMTGLYWHFVDIVWIFLFPLLYLIGRTP